jgi:hypothetical protein
MALALWSPSWHTPEDAWHGLALWGASPRLLHHHRVVLQAAQAISAGLHAAAVPHDAQWIVMGAALHDAGKLLFPHEVHGPGSQHEAAGEALLLQRGVPAHWARCCVTHGPWAASDALESLCVALADRLWRGSRCAELELCVVDAAAQRKGCDRWSIWAPLEDVFEAIAADGPARLQASRAYPV